jgi:hypothetical protein
MNSPFLFGTVVTGDHFTDRSGEIKRLHKNFRNKRNTIIISPRRLGKTSLVKQSAELFLKGSGRKRDIRFCFVDLFRARDEEDFYSIFATAVIKSTSSKFDEWVSNVKSFLGKLIPKISIGSDPQNEFSLSFDFRTTVGNYEEIFELPERLAVKYGLELILCLDEFQNLEYFKEPVLFQKRARAIWQHHHQTAYIIYGSKKHMMINLFQDKSMPFFRFGDLFFLERIDNRYLSEFVIDCFKKTGKQISKKQADTLVSSMDRHPHYVQQLGDILWNNTGKSVTDKKMEESFQMFLKQNQPFFHMILEDLTNAQLNFIHAVINGEEKFSSSEVINNYQLGSSANVKRIKEALVKKSIIEINKNEILFEEPAVKLLFERFFRTTTTTTTTTT